MLYLMNTVTMTTAGRTGSSSFGLKSKIWKIWLLPQFDKPVFVQFEVASAAIYSHKLIFLLLGCKCPK